MILILWKRLYKMLAVKCSSISVPLCAHETNKINGDPANYLEENKMFKMKKCEKQPNDKMLAVVCNCQRCENFHVMMETNRWVGRFTIRSVNPNCSLEVCCNLCVVTDTEQKTVYSAAHNSKQKQIYVSSRWCARLRINVQKQRSLSFQVSPKIIVMTAWVLGMHVCMCLKCIFSNRAKQIFERTSWSLLKTIERWKHQVAVGGRAGIHSAIQNYLMSSIFHITTTDCFTAILCSRPTQCSA